MAEKIKKLKELVKDDKKITQIFCEWMLKGYKQKNLPIPDETEIKEILNTLDERTKLILILRTIHTLSELSDAVGVTKGRIRQIEMKGLKTVTKNIYLKRPESKELVEGLNLSARTYNCLKDARIDTVDKLKQKTYKELLKIYGIGVKSLQEIKEKLAECI